MLNHWKLPYASRKQPGRLSPPMFPPMPCPLEAMIRLAQATGTTVAPVFGNALPLEATIALSEATGTTVQPLFPGFAEPFNAAITLSIATGQTDAPDHQGDAEALEAEIVLVPVTGRFAPPSVADALPLEAHLSLSEISGGEVPPEHPGVARANRSRLDLSRSHRPNRCPGYGGECSPAGSQPSVVPLLPASRSSRSTTAMPNP